MAELLRLSMTPFNLPFSVLLLCVFGYWCLFLFGAVGLDLFDIDLDLDLDADHHVELDAGSLPELSGAGDDAMNTHGSVDGAGWLLSFLRFFNVGDVPVMILVSSFACAAWATAILGSYYLNPELGDTISAALLLPNFVVSALLTKVITTPFRMLFRHANAGIAEPTQIVGRRCIVTTAGVTSRFGQARLDVDDVAAPIVINVRSREGVELTKGQQAVVLELDSEKGTYLVVPFDLGG